MPGQEGTRQRIFQKKIFFADCRVKKVLGKGFFKKKGKALPSAFLTRHSAKTPSMADGQFSLPSAVLALGKAFAEYNRAFAECPRHSAKSASPVVCVWWGSNCMNQDKRKNLYLFNGGRKMVIEKW